MRWSVFNMRWSIFHVRWSIFNMRWSIFHMRLSIFHDLYLTWGDLCHMTWSIFHMRWSIFNIIVFHCSKMREPTKMTFSQVIFMIYFSIVLRMCSKCIAYFVNIDFNCVGKNINVIIIIIIKIKIFLWSNLISESIVFVKDLVVSGII